MANTAYIVLAVVAAIFAHLWLANYAMSRPLPEAQKQAQKPWTEEEMRRDFKKAQNSTVDALSLLPSKKSRRYIVTGGSGMSSTNDLLHLSSANLCWTPYAKIYPY